MLFVKSPRADGTRNKGQSLSNPDKDSSSLTLTPNKNSSNLTITPNGDGHNNRVFQEPTTKDSNDNFSRGQ